MLKIGVLGAGHLGKIHIRLLKEIETVTLVGIYDPDPEKADFAAKEFQTEAYSSMEALLDAVDAIDIVTPTLSHHACAVKAIEKGKHFFVEKPITNTVEEADELIGLVASSGLKAQVGHVERFNPALLAARQYNINPSFIEVHRLAEFNPRGLDVPVVLDLMIHDIDVILSLVNSKVKEIHANGVSVVSDTPDIANARVEFENGCVANLTTSRVSLKNMRKARFFQRDAYITVDFLEKKVQAFKISTDGKESSSPFSFEMDPGNGKPKKQISFEAPAVPPVNAIKKELELFAESIANDTEPPVTIEQGAEALRVGHMILEKVEKNLMALANE